MKAKERIISNNNVELIKTINTRIELIHYTDKCIVVAGDTRPIKDHLKELGGKFNTHLRDRLGKKFPGWVYPKFKEQILLQALSNYIK